MHLYSQNTLEAFLTELKSTPKPLGAKIFLSVLVFRGLVQRSVASFWEYKCIFAPKNSNLSKLKEFSVYPERFLKELSAILSAWKKPRTFFME